jgi:3-phenylpropionate/trans-cinnamate dioxygenase ferredoxin reductase component
MAVLRAGAHEHARPGLFFTPMFGQIVIVGAGQAAVQAVDTLRRRGFTGKLTLIGEEPWLP